MTRNKKALICLGVFGVLCWLGVGVAAMYSIAHRAPERQGVTVPSFPYPMDKPTNIDLDTDDAGLGGK